MNEEQKEENIPTPALPENNQNIVPVNHCQVKSQNLQKIYDIILEMESWRIALVGTIALGMEAILWAIWTVIIVFNSDSHEAGIALFSIPYLFVPAILGIVIILFLYFRETRKISAILSIALSMAAFLYLSLSISIWIFFIALLIPLFYFNKTRIIAIILTGIILIVVIYDILTGMELLKMSVRFFAIENIISLIYYSINLCISIVFLFAGIQYFKKKI